MGVSEAIGMSCGCLWLPLMLYITFFVVYGCGPHDNLSHSLFLHVLWGGGVMGCLKVLPRVTFDVVDHLFVVVCGRGPNDKRNSLAIFC